MTKPDISFIADLEAIVRSRLDEGAVESYTARLAASGTRRIAQKVGEEGVETALAATAGDDVIFGTPEADFIEALEGDDFVFGQGSSDVLVGDREAFVDVNAIGGDDFIAGGDGDDAALRPLGVSAGTRHTCAVAAAPGRPGGGCGHRRRHRAGDRRRLRRLRGVLGPRPARRE